MQKRFKCLINPFIVNTITLFLRLGNSMSSKRDFLVFYIKLQYFCAKFYNIKNTIIVMSYICKVLFRF